MACKFWIPLIIAITAITLPAFADDPVKQCDTFAANPFDQDKPVDIQGVAFRNIEKDKALTACEAALLHNADEVRLIYELARVLDSTNTDLARALQLYQQAADKGYAVAMTGLGGVYEYGVGVDKNLTLAAKWYQAGAEKGDVVAQESLGWFLIHGTGVPKDYGKAREWLQKADAQDYPDAAFDLGQLYSNGWGVSQDHQKAADLYQRAADGSSVNGQNALGWALMNGYGVAKDYQKALPLLQKADARGNAGAACNLGFLYQHGWGVPKDYKKAQEFYQKAVDAGEPLGLKNLGALYEIGLGVPKDRAKARDYYEKAVAADNIPALSNLGLFYDHGLGGLHVDHVKANELYQKATDAGDTEGMAGLGANLFLGRGIKQDIATGLAKLEKAASLGSANAHEVLAHAYRDGKFVKADYPKSASYYILALEGGSVDVYDSVVTKRGAGLPSHLIDELQKVLQAKGKTFSVKRGRLSNSAVTALRSLADIGSL